TARTGTTDLDPERVNAYEAAYIHKFSSDSHLQSNLFYLENKDQIYSSSPPEFKNEMDTTIYGLELEYKGQLSSSDQLYLNYALVDGKDKDHNYLPNVAKHLVKGYYIYNFSDYLSLSGVARYVGEKQRIGEYVNLWTGTTEKDTRDEVKSYVDADMAVSYYDRKNDYHITLSAKNILASDIRYPSPPPPDTYIDDYRQEGTNFLLTISKEY
ncbi:MAG: outer rane receptor for ferrienterochelin and colicin, partial [Campylobacterota bacterium]|nr:outer rane receptor for ferrienterochelin and colicin [Campylobacterota bacterium]